jgi:hypothetical protein
LQLLRVSVQPLMGFLTRVTPLEVGQGPFASFDEKLLSTCFQKVIALPSEQTSPPSLPPREVIHQMALPLRLGGLGLRLTSSLTSHVPSTLPPSSLLPKSMQSLLTRVNQLQF